MKRTIDHISKYFTIWWIPLSINLIVAGIFVIGGFFKRDWIIDFGLLIFYLNIIGTIISSVVHIVVRKWYLIIPQLGITGFLFFYISLIIMLSPPDYYGVHKEIPNNIHFDEPLSVKPTKDLFDKDDLILVHSVQPGIYSYHTDYSPSENGYLFIKVYEITSNDRLSEHRMKEKSKIQVDIQTKTILEGEFTIYEGSWGDKYGSRIELWFQPSDGKNERKITERNYVVEGWMR